MELVSGTKINHNSAFPTPNFLRMDAVGINISDHSIKMIELVTSKKGPYKILGKYDDIPLKDGAVQNGHIKDAKAVVDALVELRKKHNLTFVRASIPEEQAYIFNSVLPAHESINIRETIAFQLSEHVPLNSSEAIFDFNVQQQDSKVEKQSKNFDVTVSVIPEKFIRELLDIFSQAKLIPLSFEIEAQTIHRAVIAEGDMTASMILDIGRTRTGISIVDNGVIEYTSTVAFGGDLFTEAIQKGKNISFEEADAFKQQHGFKKNSYDPDLYQLLIASLEPFREEIRKRISYWKSRKDKTSRWHDIEKIVLCGGHATNPGLAEHFSYTLRLPVHIANVWINACDFTSHIPEITYNHSMQYASAIGLALSHDN